VPNYNISVVVDPSGAITGVNVVENKLEGVKAKASAVETSIQRAFDFNTGPAVAQTTAVDRALDGVTTSANQAGAAVTTGLSKSQAQILRSSGTIVNSQAQIRASTLSMGQQFNDFATQVLAGGSVVTAFAQQSGQAAYAMQGLGGKAASVGAFLAGPFGTVLIIGITLLGGYVSHLLAANNALDEASKKLRDNARDARANQLAQALFAITIDGVTDALRRNAEALHQIDEAHKTAATRALETAYVQQLNIIRIRTETVALLEQARARQTLAGATVTGGTGAMQAQTADVQSAIALQARLDQANADLVQAQQQIDQALSHRVVEIVDQDPVARIRSHYDQLIEAARTRATAEGTVATALQTQVRALRDQRDIEVRAEQERERRARAHPSDGVSRFRSREQAIGIAGRELQGAGFHVGENNQFGGVTAHHTDRGHALNAIDVNVPGGGVEANDPGLRERFDTVARSYQARGYRVLWNGRIYEPGGDGPGPLIPAHNRRGEAISPHRNHLHLEAPASIVGRESDGSTTSQALRELQAAAREAEQQSDFVQGIVDQAGQRGQGGSTADRLQSQIARTLADFQRRFNRAATTGAGSETERITNALTEAEAREIADHFKTAYTDPLARLTALQGTTGISRQILNAQLEEADRIGRHLTTTEAALIDTSLRQKEALSAQADVLQQIKGPQEEYETRLAALNALLAAGTINQTAYNSQIGALNAPLRDAIRTLPGLDPNSGRSYSDVAARGDEQARYDAETQNFESHQAQLLAMGINYNALIEAAHQRHIENLNNIDRQRYSVMLQGAQSTFESLADIAKNAAGEQSAIYIGMFAISKAFAIAQSIIAIQQGIAEALKLPFPANIPAIASVVAAGASIVANISAVALKFSGGGYVSGPGGATSDSIPAQLSNGEYVVNAEATRNNRVLLETINARRRPVRAFNDNGAAGGSGGRGEGNLTIQTGDIHVHGAGGDGKQIGREVKTAILSIVRDELKTQKRDGGALTRGAVSVMAS
jgi:hypothetical protein